MRGEIQPLGQHTEGDCGGIGPAPEVSSLQAQGFGPCTCTHHASTGLWRHPHRGLRCCRRGLERGGPWPWGQPSAPEDGEGLTTCSPRGRGGRRAGSCHGARAL
jgi:hypothetical protein